MRLTYSSLMLLASFVTPHSFAQAASGPWTSNERVEARLISAVEATGGLARLPLGLQLKLKPGWKTYWRSPGEAGVPPQIDFGASPDVTTAAFAYPIPHRFTLLGIDTFGYKDMVVLPLGVTVASPGQKFQANARLDLLVCSQICVPETLSLSLVLPLGVAVPGEEAALINRFSAMVPGDGRASGLEIGAVRAMGSGKTTVLEITASAREAFEEPDIFAEADNASFGKPSVTLTNDAHNAIIRLPVNNPTNAAVTLTLADGLRSVVATPSVTAAIAPSWQVRLWALLPMLGLGLLGGFILNFMPCVLPVLSLKLLSVVSQGGRQQRHVRAGFLAAAAGILVSFLIIAAGLIALKAGGQTIGWGIQFQQPLFLTAMVVVLCLFACNLAGWFEITLPSAMTNRLGQAGETGLLGNFASGAFATLLATPCSAPFLGTAVGFALSAGPAEILGVFLCLGIGLAAPWLVVAAYPALSARLPRPGMWMHRLRQFLGAAMVATAVWLLTVMAAQTGTLRPWLVAAAMAGMALAFYLRQANGAGRLGSVSYLAPAAIIAILATSLVVPPSFQTQTAEVGWQKFDPDVVKSLVSQGKTVLVDVTADWCLTCQANKRLVLDSGPVAAMLGSAIVPLKADWTRPDPTIAGFLARHGKFGIPFNIIYGPGAPSGIILPELLTNSDVMEAMVKARGGI